MNWLLIDIGNTHTVAGIFPAEGFSQPATRYPQVRFRTDAQATADEYRAHVAQLFGKPPEVERVIVSTVVPALERVVREAFRGSPVLVVNHETRRDFELDLPQPSQLGADRLANVAGALTLVKTPFLIVDAGTATTFCLVDERPAYVGGAITPGLETGWKSLQARAAKLFSVELKRPETAVGNTTESQLQSGVLFGYEALIEGMCRRLVEDAATKWPRFNDAQWIATGGCIQLLKLSDRFFVEPDLTLIGLHRYGQLTR